MRRTSPTLRKLGFGLIYGIALVVWAGLVADTIGLARQAAVLPPLPPTAVPPTSIPPTAPPPPTNVPAFAAATPLPALPIAAAEPAPQEAVVHPKTGRYISAWLPNTFNSENRRSFEENADILDEVSPFWYAPDVYGNLYHDAHDKELVDLAHSKNVLVIPTIHNVVHGVDPVPSIISSPERRKRHIQLIVAEVLEHNYDGFDIDYEGLPSNLRSEYSTFITELADALHAQGKLLTIAVHAKASDWGGLGGFQDWVVLGKAVDRLRIMTYDYHWRGGGAGPIAPVYWVNQVAEYAKSVVDPAKVVIGVPFYGYNWGAGGNAAAQLWTMINSEIQSRKLALNFMESNANGLVQENWITYGGRQVWFANKRSLESKLTLVQQHDLAGIAIWRLGGEDPENWPIIRQKLVEDPFESQRMINRVLPQH